MSGFRGLVAAAARSRRLRHKRLPQDELEEQATRWASTRRPLDPGLRRPSTHDAAVEPAAPPPRWIGTLAAADPATATTPPRLDWPGWLGTGHELGVHAFLAIMESAYHQGSEAPLESLHGGTDRPLIVDDPIVEPLQALELLARPIDGIVLDPALLGADSLNEAHALVRDFGATAVFVVRTVADVEALTGEGPTALLLDRLDPDSLRPVPGLADRLLEAMQGFPALRFLGGGIRSAAAAQAAARRAVDAILLDSDWLWTPERREELAALPGLIRGDDGISAS